MTSTPLPSPRIPLHSCEALLEKLKWDYAELERGWTEYRTFNFVITAHHLYTDWIKSAGTLDQQKRKGIVSRYASGKLLFDTFKDITNATKHFKLDTKNKSNQVVSEVSQPQTASWYAYLIAGDVIYVTVGLARPSMPELADTAVKCLEWILSGTGTSLPIDLAEGLDIIFRPLI